MSRAKSYVPERGDIIWIHLDPQMGREQAGHRTCLVLSPALYNGKTGLAVLCPITTKVKGFPFEVPLPAGIATTGVVLADHIKNLDWQARRARFREKAPAHLVQEVLDTTLTLLEPEDSTGAPA
ncbi:MAG: endoribonuclease MazF [Gemmataceae bacterium]